MKKLSISLFAALAIVLALTSAFTTKKATSSDPFWFPVTSSELVGAFDDAGHYDVIASYGGSPITPISVQDAGELCNSTSDSNPVCAVRYLNFDKANSTSSGQLDSGDLGDFGAFVNEETGIFYQED